MNNSQEWGNCACATKQTRDNFKGCRNFCIEIIVSMIQSRIVFIKEIICMASNIKLKRITTIRRFRRHGLFLMSGKTKVTQTLVNLKVFTEGILNYSFVRHTFFCIFLWRTVSTSSTLNQFKMSTQAFSISIKNNITIHSKLYIGSIEVNMFGCELYLISHLLCNYFWFNLFLFLNRFLYNVSWNKHLW